MSDDLSKINYVRELSGKTVNNIKQNIAVSLINIAFMVTAALLGYLGLVSGLLLNEISATSSHWKRTQIADYQKQV